jgi:hypothetical protein
MTDQSPVIVRPPSKPSLLASKVACLSMTSNLPVELQPLGKIARIRLAYLMKKIAKPVKLFGIWRHAVQYMTWLWQWTAQFSLVEGSVQAIQVRSVCETVYA